MAVDRALAATPPAFTPRTTPVFERKRTYARSVGGPWTPKVTGVCRCGLSRRSGRSPTRITRPYRAACVHSPETRMARSRTAG